MDRILSLSSAELLIDRTKNLAFVRFTGDERYDDNQKVLASVAELVKGQDVVNLILDRTRIGKSDAKCRIWFKNEYLRIHVRPLIAGLEKIAVVESGSIAVQLYRKAFYASLSMIYPSLQFKFFSHTHKAKAWLLPDMTVSYNAGREGRGGEEPMVVGYKAPQYQKPHKIATLMSSDNRAKSNSCKMSAKEESSLPERFFSRLFPQIQ